MITTTFAQPSMPTVGRYARGEFLGRSLGSHMSVTDSIVSGVCMIPTAKAFSWESHAWSPPV